MSCLLAVIHAGRSHVLSDACLSSVIQYRCYVSSVASIWLHVYLVVFLLCSCMVFIHDASGHDVLMVELCLC